MNINESCQKTIWEGLIGKDLFRLIERKLANVTLLIVEPLADNELSNIAKGKTTFAESAMSGAVAGFAWNAVRDYYKNKEQNVKFHAPDQSSKHTYEKIVRELERMGHWKVMKRGPEKSGYSWELVKK